MKKNKFFSTFYEIVEAVLSLGGGIIKLRNRPFIIVFLAIFPGLGHFCLHYRRKAISLFFVFILILVTFLFSRSLVIKGLMGFVYISLVISSAVESFYLAKGDHKNIFSVPYIIFMLLTTGMSALPLLWESDLFTRFQKIVWTLAVALLAILFFSFLGLLLQSNVV